MSIKKTTTIEITRRKVNGKWKKFFRTAVPKDLGIEVLGLNLEEKKQKLTWIVKDKALKVVVE